MSQSSAPALQSPRRRNKLRQSRSAAQIRDFCLLQRFHLVEEFQESQEGVAQGMHKVLGIQSGSLRVFNLWNSMLDLWVVGAKAER